MKSRFLDRLDHQINIPSLGEARLRSNVSPETMTPPFTSSVAHCIYPYIQSFALPKFFATSQQSQHSVAGCYRTCDQLRRRSHCDTVPHLCIDLDDRPLAHHPNCLSSWLSCSTDLVGFSQNYFEQLNQLRSVCVISNFRLLFRIAATEDSSEIAAASLASLGDPD